MNKHRIYISYGKGHCSGELVGTVGVKEDGTHIWGLNKHYVLEEYFLQAGSEKYLFVQKLRKAVEESEEDSDVQVMQGIEYVILAGRVTGEKKEGKKTIYDIAVVDPSLIKRLIELGEKQFDFRGPINIWK